VTDSFGTPMPSAQIQLSLVTLVNGQRRLVSPAVGTNNVATDDRGAYRIYGLLPGDYIVRATVGGANGGPQARVMTPEELSAAAPTVLGPMATQPVVTRPLVRMSTYYPNVTDVSQAEPISLAAGEDRGGIDIVTVFGSRTAVRINGIALSPDGQPISNVLVGVANLSSGAMWSSPGLVRPGADGTFSINNLPPGRWLLFGRAGDPSANTNNYVTLPWWTNTEVFVGDQDVSGVVMRFDRGVPVTGRIEFRGTKPPADLSRMRVGLQSLTTIADAAIPISPATPRADGTFTIDNVPAGQFRVTVTGTGAWSLRSATVAGRDTLDEPLELSPGQSTELTLTLTDELTELSGILRDQLGRPAPEYAVIAFPVDRSLRMSAPRRNSGLVKAATDGRYQIAGLPPGEYLLCVVTDADPRQIADLSFLDGLAPGGVHISLAEGEKLVQDLKIGG